MEVPAILFFTFLSGLIVVQMTTWPFLVNLLLSSILSILLLFLAILGTYLLPVEQFLFAIKPPKVSIKPVPVSVDVATDSRVINDEIMKKIRELIGHIVRDFILDWYNTVTNDVEFVQQAFELFEHIFTEVRVRISAVDSEEFTQILLRRLLRHLTCYKHALECVGPQNSNDPERLQQLLVVSYEKLHGHLAMSNLPDTEIEHLRSLVAIILKSLLPKDFSLNGTSLYLVRELIAQNVLFALVDLLSSPRWINGAVVRVLSEENIGGDDSDLEEEAGSDTSSSTDNEIRTVIETPDSNIEMSSYLTSSYNPVEQGPTAEACTVHFATSSEDDRVELNIPTMRLETIGESIQDQDSNGLQMLSTNLSNNNASAVDPLTPLTLNVEHFAESDDAKPDNSPKRNSFSHGGFYSPKYEANLKASGHDKIFQHVRIPEAITTEEAFETGSKYTLYKITYQALSTPPAQRKRFLSQFKRNPETQPSDEHKELKSFEVQRRFREFLTLQDRLNENSTIRKLIHNIRGPSRMFPMPIGNMDKDYIEKRRLFLQAYLRELCIHPQVCQSNEMKEFLAYNLDPRLAYVRQPTEMIPRFDKMFKKAVQEFLGTASTKISDTFTSDHDSDYYVPSSPRDQSMTTSKSLTHLSEQTSDSEPDAKPLPRSITSSLLLPSGRALPPTVGPVTKFKNLVLGRPSNPLIQAETTRDFCPFKRPKNGSSVSFGRSWRTPGNLLANRNRFSSLTAALRRTQGDGCDKVETFFDTDKKYLGEFAIAGKLFSLTRKIWSIGLGINTMSFLAVGRYSTQYLCLQLKVLTSRETWLKYLSVIQDALWPKGEWGSSKTTDEDVSSQLESAQRCLEEALPDVLPLIVGRTEYKEGVADVLASFQNQTINRHLVYHLLDTVIQLLFPDLQAILSQRNNVSM